MPSQIAGDASPLSHVGSGVDSPVPSVSRKAGGASPWPVGSGGISPIPAQASAQPVGVGVTVARTHSISRCRVTVSLLFAALVVWRDRVV